MTMVNMKNGLTALSYRASVFVAILILLTAMALALVAVILLLERIFKK